MNAVARVNRMQRAHTVEELLVDGNLHHKLPNSLGDIWHAQVKQLKEQIKVLGPVAHDQIELVLEEKFRLHLIIAALLLLVTVAVSPRCIFRNDHQITLLLVLLLFDKLSLQFCDAFLRDHHANRLFEVQIALF